MARRTSKKPAPAPTTEEKETPPGPVPVEPENTAAVSADWLSYFTLKEWVYYLLLITLGCVLRWYDLEARPLHHDESIHANFAKSWYDNPDLNYYKYDPTYHGASLYDLYRLTFSTFGVTNWALRAPMALIGCLLVLTPFLFRRYISKMSVFALTGAFALSPTLIYWSRFSRHDPLVVAALFLILFGVTLSKPKYRAPVVCLGLALHITSKEDIYVHLAMFAGYLLYEICLGACIHSGQLSLLKRMAIHIKTNPVSTALGIILFIFIYTYFFTAGFSYYDKLNAPKHAWDYWHKQHLIERISGPFLFNFYMLSWYELPFVIIAGIHYFHIFARAQKALQVASLVTWVTIIGALIYIAKYGFEVPNGMAGLAEFIKIDLGIRLKDSLDVAGFIFYIPYAVILTTFHLLRREQTLAVWAYLFSASLFCYSALNEKVPWLAMYPFIFGLVYLTLYFDSYLKQYSISTWREFPWSKALLIIGLPTVLLGLVFIFEEESSIIFRSFEKPGTYLQYTWLLISGVLILAAAAVEHRFRSLGTFNLFIGLWLLIGAYNFRASILTNFTYAGDAREYISQVHTTKETHELSLRIRSMIEYPLQGFRPVVSLTGEPSWPIFWYLRDLPTLRFELLPHEREKCDYIIQDFHEPPKDVPEGFVPIQIKLRGWWVPDFDKMTVKKFLNYAVNHTNWSDTGFSYGHFLVNTKTIPQERF